jgi:hypothetical protein
MDAAAYYGLPGQIVNTIAPYSEADPVALLMHVLVGTGNMLGRGPYALVEKTEHTCGEFVVLVGDTSKARKGQSWSTPRYLLAQADEHWAATRIRSGLSSGEGLIFNVRDARYETDRKGTTTCVDEGEQDKRLLVFEPELATVLRRMQGELNTVSSIIREAWESGTLGTLTKNSPLRATDAHISIIAHVTREELVATLNEISRANGFANRFLYALVRRARPLPSPGEIPEAALAPLVKELQALARPWRGPLHRDADAEALWCEIYPKLSEGEAGLVGAILARSEAHVLRLSIIYAALDRSDLIREPHLRAALAAWRYSEDSVRQIFGQVLGLTTADTILAALKAQGPLTRTQISELFKRHKPAAEIDSALYLLVQAGKAVCTMTPPVGGVGRSVETWAAKEAKDAK